MVKIIYACFHDGLIRPLRLVEGFRSCLRVHAFNTDSITSLIKV